MAFGSRVWEVFRELDALRFGLPVDVYIYASHDNINRTFETTWCAKYIESKESFDGTHPDGIRFRPPTTINDKDVWAVFWEVIDLRPAAEIEKIEISNCTSYGKRKSYGKFFFPERPLLIEHP